MRNRASLWTIVFASCLTAAASAMPPDPPAGPCCWPPPCTCSCLTPPPNMVGWWTLDEPGPTFHDRALGNDGTGANTFPISPGINGGAKHFDGATSQIGVPDSQPLDFGTGDFSIDLWLRTSFNSRSVLSILDKRTVAPVGYHLFLYRGFLGLQLADASGYTNYVSDQFVATGSWNHVAVTVARSAAAGIVFYLNGTPSLVTGNPTLRPGTLANAVPLTIGNRSSSFSSAFWRGDLDEIELFQRVLKVDEVKAIWSAGTSGKCKCAPLAVAPRAWWRFDEPAGTLALDSGSDPQGPFDGTVSGAQRLAAGRVRGDLSFNGSSDAVSVANDAPLGLTFSPGPGGALSIDAWIKTQAPSGPIVTHVGIDPLDRGAIGYSLAYFAGQLDFSVQALDAGFLLSSLQASCTTCPPLNDGLWHLVGVAFSWGPGGNAAFVTLYQDGVPVATASGNLAGQAGGSFRIGAQVPTNRPANPSFFSDEIDEVELFDRVLTQEDFGAIFAAGASGKCLPCDLAPRETTACGKGALPACPGGQYCDFLADCGTKNSGGLCAVRPHVCSPVSRPVCGCDKETYANSCEAASRGITVDHAGSCP